MDKFIGVAVLLLVIVCMITVGQVLVGLHNFDVMAVVQSIHGGQ